MEQKPRRRRFGSEKKEEELPANRWKKTHPKNIHFLAAHFAPVPFRPWHAGLLRLSKDRGRFVPYLNQLMQDVGQHSVAARLLFLQALLDDGDIDFVEQQIKELSQCRSFTGLLEGVKRRLAEERQSRENRTAKKPDARDGS